MVELIVAMAVIAIAIGPVFNLLSSSNKVSNASMYEVMASLHAGELSEQLLRLKPTILHDLRQKTGKGIDQLIADPAFQQKLSPDATLGWQAIMAALPAPTSETDITFFLSPLDPAFISRTINVQEVAAATELFTSATGRFFNVYIGLSWKLNPNDQVVHGATFSCLLRESP